MKGKIKVDLVYESIVRMIKQRSRSSVTSTSYLKEHFVRESSERMEGVGHSDLESGNSS